MKKEKVYQAINQSIERANNLYNIELKTKIKKLENTIEYQMVANKTNIIMLNKQDKIIAKMMYKNNIKNIGFHMYYFDCVGKYSFLILYPTVTQSIFYYLNLFLFILLLIIFIITVCTNGSLYLFAVIGIIKIILCLLKLYMYKKLYNIKIKRNYEMLQ